VVRDLIVVQTGDSTSESRSATSSGAGSCKLGKIAVILALGRSVTAVS